MEAEYKYNGLGELLEARDSEGNPLQATYDIAGRRKSLYTPDMGRKEYWHDMAGNVVSESDGNLAGAGGRITYAYDGLNRLREITYPRRSDTQGATRTTYSYGPPDAGYNTAGRVTEIQDESGSTKYRYGKLGETVWEEKTIKTLDSVRLTKEKTAVMSYASDYLGRMKEITYPDGETVKYEYDYGGQVTRATGTRAGVTFNYVNEIRYDKYGQRVYIEYGNNMVGGAKDRSGKGVTTEYKYDEKRRWLTGIKTGKDGRVYQEIKYDFDPVGNVLGYENNSSRYTTRQNYEYDNLYQLAKATGYSRQMLYEGGDIEAYTSEYEQAFRFDRIGNMESKVSREHKTNFAKNGMDLNYDLDYHYYKTSEGYKTHRAEKIGEMYYLYDRNGNVVNERTGGHSQTSGYSSYDYNDGIYSVPYGFALSRPREEDTEYERAFAWDFSNRLIKTRDNNYTVHYRYGFDNKRVLKYTEVTRNESLYFNNMWQISSTNTQAWLQSKHIFVGDTRIATKSSYDDTGTNYGFEEKHQYWHHGDHLGSAQLITNYQGLLHERIEYAPYGELWIEHRYEADSFALPYLFTGKELDPETNLYYYGARYLDPKRSRWISGDPAMGEYIPGAPVNDEARKRNQDLPGMGGVFNIVNLHTYHYAGNNPVRITDPTGRDDVLMTDELQKKIDNYFEQNAKSQSLLTDISSALISEILGFDVNGQPTVGESMAGVANMLSTFTGAMSYIAESEELIAGASKSLGGFSSIVGWLSTGPNVYTAFTDRSVDSVSNAAGSIAGVAFNFPLGIIAGPSTKVITKAVGETAIAGAKLNNTLKHEPIKVFQAMFNFAVRFR